jgi:hypothetical protein
LLCVACVESPVSKKPLLSIDVNIGKDQGKQKIVIFQGDSPSSKAKEFSERYGNYLL